MTVDQPKFDSEEWWWEFLGRSGPPLIPEKGVKARDLRGYDTRSPFSLKQTAQIYNAIVNGLVAAAVAGPLVNLLEDVQSPRNDELATDIILQHTTIPFDYDASHRDFVRMVARSIWTLHIGFAKTFQYLDDKSDVRIMRHQPNLDDEDVQYLIDEFSSQGFRTGTYIPQGTAHEFEVILNWMRDDAEVTAFNAVIALSAHRIYKHFRDRGKTPPRAFRIWGGKGTLNERVEIPPPLELDKPEAPTTPGDPKLT